MKEFLSAFKEGILIAEEVENGNTFFKRFKGLMGRAVLRENQGYYLSPCTSIHTFSMRFSIDALFLSTEGIVLDIEHEMKPWRVKSAVKNAQSVLELPAASAVRQGISIGDRITLQRNQLI